MQNSSCDPRLLPKASNPVTTSNPSRDLGSPCSSLPLSQPLKPRCNTLKTEPVRDLKAKLRPQTIQPKSQHEIHVTTKANQSQPQPCRDLQFRSLPRTKNHQVTHTALLPCALGALLVTTPNLVHNPALEFGSSHSSFCLVNFFFFFQNPPVALLPLIALKKKTCYSQDAVA